MRRWGRGIRLWKLGRTYGTIDDVLIARIVVDVYCYATQSGDFGGEFVEARVVLSVLFSLALCSLWLRE